MPYALVAQDCGKTLIFLPTKVPLAGGQNCADVVVLPGSGAVGEIVRRVVEVQVLAIPAFDEVLHVKGAAHGYDAGDLIGVAEAEVGGMKGAEAAPGGDQPRGRVLPFHQGKHIVDQVALILHVPLHSPVGVGMLVIPTLPVNTVDAIKLQLPAFYPVGHAAYHAVVFVLKEPALGSGEDQNPGSCVTKTQQLHVAAQVL